MMGVRQVVSGKTSSSAQGAGSVNSRPSLEETYWRGWGGEWEGRGEDGGWLGRMPPPPPPLPHPLPHNTRMQAGHMARMQAGKNKHTHAG